MCVLLEGGFQIVRKQSFIDCLVPFVHDLEAKAKDYVLSRIQWYALAGEIFVLDQFTGLRDRDVIHVSLPSG